MMGADSSRWGSGRENLGHMYSVAGKFLDWAGCASQVSLGATPFYLRSSTACMGSVTGNTESVPRLFQTFQTAVRDQNSSSRYNVIPLNPSSPCTWSGVFGG